MKLLISFNYFVTAEFKEKKLKKYFDKMRHYLKNVFVLIHAEPLTTCIEKEKSRFLILFFFLVEFIHFIQLFCNWLVDLVQRIDLKKREKSEILQ